MTPKSANSYVGVDSEMQFDYELLIVGAGPQALCLAASIAEGHSEATTNDAQRLRAVYWGRSNKGGNERHSAVRDGLSGREADIQQQILAKTLVVDPSGQWLTRWNSQMRVLDIVHLRSPVIHHPDASDKWALLNYAYSTGRANELYHQDQVYTALRTSSQERIKRTLQKRGANQGQSIKAVPEGQRYAYGLPSTALFDDFCKETIAKYGLGKLVVKGAVAEIDPIQSANHENPVGFKVTLDNGHTVTARQVVLAQGPTTQPIFPDFANEILAAPKSARPPTRLLHVHDLIGLDSAHATSESQSQGLQQVWNAVQGKQVVVVGGGLSAAHLARTLLVNHGADHVTMVVRGTAVRQNVLDVSTGWVGNHRALRLAGVYADTKNSVDVVKDARRGGTITPQMAEELKILGERGALSTWTHSEIQRGIWCNETDEWELSVDCSGNPREIRASHVFLATGWTSEISHDPIFGQLLAKIPTATISGGQPALGPDLRWGSNVNIYVMGPHAMHALGPDAQNLNGGRGAAGRIRDAVVEVQRNLLPGGSDDDEEEIEGVEGDVMKTYVYGNPYTLLEVC